MLDLSAWDPSFHTYNVSFQMTEVKFSITQGPYESRHVLGDIPMRSFLAFEDAELVWAPRRCRIALGDSRWLLPFSNIR